mmetsp:Transcript_92549/g.299470  ORF Transcript_92549/g.299470 Transcript_92549/m.299470 type:complete len:259 (-) Transcript_92549:591-1367(-)
MRGVRLSLLFQARYHARNQVLHFCEGVQASVRTVVCGRGHARGELRERGRPLLQREVPDEAHGLEAGKVRTRGERQAAELQEGRLVEPVGKLLRARRVLRDGLLRGRNGRELLAAAPHLRLVVLGLREAGVVQVLEGGGVAPEDLGRLLDVALSSRLLLSALGHALLGLVQLLVGILELVLQRLLQHLEVVAVLLLLCPRLVQLGLTLLQEIFQSLDDAAALRLVGRDRWRAGGLVVAVLGLLRALQQGREPLPVCRA